MTALFKIKDVLFVNSSWTRSSCRNIYTALYYNLSPLDNLRIGYSQYSEHHLIHTLDTTSRHILDTASSPHHIITLHIITTHSHIGHHITSLFGHRLIHIFGPYHIALDTTSHRITSYQHIKHWTQHYVSHHTNSTPYHVITWHIGYHIPLRHHITLSSIETCNKYTFYRKCDKF